MSLSPRGKRHRAEGEEARRLRREHPARGRRRRPNPLLLLAAALGAYATVSLGFALWNAVGELPYRGPLARAEATVVDVDYGWLGLGAKPLLVTWQVNGEQLEARLRVEDLPLEVAVPERGDQVAIEFPVANPSRARPAGTSSFQADERASSVEVAAVTGTASATLGLGWLLFVRRRRLKGDGRR